MSDSTRMYGQYASDMVGEDQKTCSFCGKVLPLSAFAKNGVDPYGAAKYRNDCRDCYNIRRKENRTADKHTAFTNGQRRRGEESQNFSFHEWKDALIFFGGKCAYCGCTPKKGQRLTRDHLVALSQGGKTEAGNIVPACRSCNSSKGPKDFKIWFMEQCFFSQDNLNLIYKWRNIMRQAYGDDVQ